MALLQAEMAAALEAAAANRAALKASMEGDFAAGQRHSSCKQRGDSAARDRQGRSQRLIAPAAPPSEDCGLGEHVIILDAIAVERVDVEEEPEIEKVEEDEEPEIVYLEPPTASSGGMPMLKPKLETTMPPPPPRPPLRPPPPRPPPPSGFELLGEAIESRPVVRRLDLSYSFDPNPNPNPNPDPNPDPNPNPNPHPNPHPDPNASRELESITIPAPTKPHDAGGEGKPKTPRPPKSAYLCFEQVRAR